jgi:poly(A) polymerase
MAPESGGKTVSVEKQVIAWLSQQDLAIYLVGGSVRDQLLGRPLYDLDLAVSGDGLALARRLADRFHGAYYPLDEERGTGRTIVPGPQAQGLIVDVARFRGSTPSEPTLATDLADRDFTINALASNVRTPHKVIDLHDGLADLEARLIRPISQTIIRDDPLRALRAIRQAAEMDFALAPETAELIRRDGWALAQVSGERIRDELARILVRPQAAASLLLLNDLEILTIILPELEPLRGLAQPPPHRLPVLAHSLETVHTLELIIQQAINLEPPISSTLCPIPNINSLLPFAPQLETHLSQTMSGGRPRLVTLKLAALLHDTGKRMAQTIEEGG